MKNSIKIESNYEKNRLLLRELSLSLRALIKEGVFSTINEALIDHYENDGHKNFKTFNQWKKDGKSIIKGSKAFFVWGTPKDIPHPDPESDDEEFKYFPLCYLFSENQVEKRSRS